ncbi:MAG TPA: M1 family aminopeptidase [Candidatus Eremiobacteraceae bacterium]|nr:M1 family aminopeptidase [Candidatus Eremiobacteraceae bacterium]
MTHAYCRRADASAAPSGNGRKPFALPGAKQRYAPDRPARVDHIALTLSFDFDEKILFGKCATTFTAVGKQLSSIEFDAAQLTIRRVRGPRGAALPFSMQGAKLRVQLPKLAAGRSTSVIVEYEARQPRQGIYFIGPDEGYPAKPVHVWTQGQDQDAHYWFPCIDYPNAKATTEVTATVPKAFFVLSNGRLIGTTENKSAKTKTYHWKMETPHVTYLVSCVAGKFSGRTSTVKGTPVSYYVHPGREADGERSFGKTPAMVKFFSDRLRFPYPYAQYSQIAVSDFIFGGMENTTATTQTDTTLHDARAHLDFSSDGLVAHELAHQWFGDLLTCKDWSHAWLNEGFATYFEALFKEFDLGKDEFDYYRLEMQARYLHEDSQHYRRSIVTSIFGEPVEIFDRHLYEKGACVLHMVRAELGDDLFWQSLHAYVTTNQRRNVETVDLGRAIEETTGRNFAPFFDQWVFKAGHPEFRVRYTWDAEGGQARVDVAQAQTVDDATPLFRVPIAVEFGFGRGKSERRQIVCDASQQTFAFALASEPQTFCFDPDADIIKTIELEVPTEMLVRQLERDSRIATRIQAIRALAKEASPDAVAAIAHALQRDPFWGVQADAARALGRIRGAEPFRALLRARSVKHPKARRAVAEALGEFHTDAAFEALEPLLKKDASYFVEAQAAHSIGKTKAKRAYATLTSALAKKESWQEAIRGGIFAGLADLGDERAVPTILAWTAYGRPAAARRTAVTALGKLGEGRKDVRDTLLDLLDDRNYHVRIASIDALQTMHESAAIEPLERLAAQDVDGRLKRRCMEAAASIREHLSKPAEVQRMRDELSSVRDAHRALQERLASLEAAAKPARKPRRSRS